MITKLIAYQEVDAKLRKIEMELAKSEERKKMSDAKKFLKGVQEKLDKINLRASELNQAYESAIKKQKELHAKSLDFSGPLKSVEEVNEAEYLLKKADELDALLKTLTSDIERLENEIKGLIVEYKTLATQTKKYQEVYAENKSKYDELKGAREGEMKQIEKELSALAKDIDASVLELYNKKRNDEKIFPILFECRENVCGACNMELPSLTISKLKGGEIIECDQCRRLIYIKK
jgi:predicted  nucleic acid-binding Zn-ribbon protein